MRAAIGFDTGGTYTDAVLYDFETKQILGTGKALTTKENLCIGIGNALDKLPSQYFESVCAVSLSTTLATNACVEDRGGNAKLIFFGGDKKIVEKYGSEYGLPPIQSVLMEDCKTDLNGNIEKMPDWEQFERDVPSFCEHADGIGIIELYSVRNNAVIEKKAKEIVERCTDLPVTCGYELFNELNSLRRGAGTMLNAQLYPVIREFIRAIKKVMSERGLNAPIVIMRSDGSLMDESFAKMHPVETLLCGPAASVMGAFGLTEESNAVVVDMGGTTTDIALIQNGEPVRAADGVDIGKWRTLVNGLMIRTVGLGGDSGIRYKDRNLILEETRFIPLCVLAERYPTVKTRLKQLIQTGKTYHSKYLYEFYVLNKDISDCSNYTQQERDFCRALKNGPLILQDAAAAIHEDIYTFRINRLLREGIVMISGLTPTDIMHVRGDYSMFDREMSWLAAGIVAENLETDVNELCERVYSEVCRKMYVNIVKMLLRYRYKRFARGEFGAETEYWIDLCYRTAIGENSGLLAQTLTTDCKLIGIGAPIGLFLNRVAQLLGTEAIIPEHAEVANAVGAVSGGVYAVRTVEIRPGDDGYTVHGITDTRVFKELEEAEQFAKKDAESAARAEAKERGAKGEISSEVRVEYSYSSTKYSEKKDALFLGAAITARAIASIGFTA